MRACTRGTSAELAALRAELETGSIAALLADAVIAHCDGDVARADRLLRHAWRASADAERAPVAELWLPILISLKRFDEAEEVLADEHLDRNDVRFVALRSVIAAARGDAAASRDFAADAEARAADEADPAARARVHQRLGLAAFFRMEPEEALAHSAAAIGLARSHRAHRTAVTAHSVAYATHASLTGDLFAALRSAREMTVDATLAGDRAYRAVGLVATYERLVELGDDEGIAATLEQLRAAPLAEQYRERFSSRLADAMTQAAGGDFAGARNVFVVLADEDGRAIGERALCRALAALSNFAVGDDDAARKLSRRAVGGSARVPANLPAIELYHRRLARAIGCATCLLLGDVVRADRRADAMLLRSDADIAGLVAAGRGVKAAALSPKVRGYARLIEAAHERRSVLGAPGPLTAAEIEIFRHLDAGLNARRSLLRLAAAHTPSGRTCATRSRSCTRADGSMRWPKRESWGFSDPAEGVALRRTYLTRV